MRRSFARSGGVATLMALWLAVFTVGTMFADDDNDKRKNNGGESVGDCTGRNNCAEGASGSSDDRRISGSIVAINTLVDPNEIVLGTLDGPVTVKMFGKDAPFLVKQSGVRVGEYIEVVGYKENESLFFADTISEPSDK
jgi:hypothetical protein